MMANVNLQDCTSRSTFDEWCNGLEDVDAELKVKLPQEDQLDLFDDQTA